MVGDRHEAARPHVRAQRAGGVREQEDLGAGRGERAHRRAERVEIGALVLVSAALEDHHRHPADPSRHRAAGVALDARPGEAGQLLVAELRGVLHRVGHAAQAGAQHDAHARPQPGAFG